jgi:hypothetical protein
MRGHTAHAWAYGPYPSAFDSASIKMVLAVIDDQDQDEARAIGGVVAQLRRLVERARGNDWSWPHRTAWR